MPRTSSLPTSSPSTNSGRLSHHMVSLRLGSDVPGKTQNTWKLPDISSLHNVSKTGTVITLDEGANLYFSRRISIPSIKPPIQTVRSSPIIWRAVRSEAIVDRDSVRTKLTTIALAIGGAERDRTADLLVANEALSQLSYSPTAQVRVVFREPRQATHAANNRLECNRKAHASQRR